MKAWVLLASLWPALALAAPEGQRTVVVGTHVNQVYGIDIKNNQFTVDFYVWFRWEGDDFKPIESFEVAGGRIISKTGIERKKLGALDYTSARVVETINTFWDLRRFPLDSHTLEIELEDAEHDERTLVYQRDGDNIGISPDLQLPGFVVRSTNSEARTHVYHTNYGDTSMPSNNESRYSRYHFTIDIERPGFGRFWKVFFGLFISVLVSWCAFWVRPKESSPRVSLGVGATFAASAVTVTINNSLPDTNAVTLADKFIMLTLGFIVASVVVTILALTLHAQNQEALQQHVDRVCRWLFPVTYGVLLWLTVSTA